MANETEDRVKRTMATRPVMVLLRLLLFVFDVIFWATGVAVLALGILSRIKLSIFVKMSGPETDIVCWSLMGAGVFIILISLLGFYATFSSKPWMLKLYGFLMIILFLGEFGAGIFCYIKRGTMKSSFKEGLTSSLNKYSTDEKVKNSVDELQETVECCGVTNYTDWFEIFDDDYVPTSCCEVSVNCVHENLKTTSNMTIYTEGCYNKVVGTIDGELAIIGASALGVALVQIIGIMFSCCLAGSINKNTYEVV